jgi:hypothetical protein
MFPSDSLGRFNLNKNRLFSGALNNKVDLGPALRHQVRKREILSKVVVQSYRLADDKVLKEGADHLTCGGSECKGLIERSLNPEIEEVEFRRRDLLLPYGVRECRQFKSEQGVFKDLEVVAYSAPVDPEIPSDGVVVDYGAATLCSDRQELSKWDKIAHKLFLGDLLMDIGSRIALKVGVALFSGIGVPYRGEGAPGKSIDKVELIGELSVRERVKIVGVGATGEQISRAPLKLTSA